MQCLEFVLMVDAHGGLGDAHIERLTDKTPRCRVATLFHLKVAVTVQFCGDPTGTLWHTVGKWLEHRLFGLDKAFQWWRACGAVNAVTGVLHHPVHQLLIGVREIAELA